MKEVKVLMTKRNFRGFLYAINKKITEYQYKNNKVAETNHLSPKREYYTVVDKLEYQPDMANSDIFQKIKTLFKKKDKVEEIRKKAINKDLNISHYRFSAGDVIAINDTYYISDGISMRQIDFT